MSTARRQKLSSARMVQQEVYRHGKGLFQKAGLSVTTTRVKGVVDEEGLIVVTTFTVQCSKASKEPMLTQRQSFLI
jgi:hypothetical protein